MILVLFIRDVGFSYSKQIIDFKSKLKIDVLLDKRFHLIINNFIGYYFITDALSFTSLSFGVKY